MSTHIIHKQKVTLQIPKEGDANVYYGHVSNLMQNELPARIETILDQLFPTDKIIRIASLKLDLGSINPQNFEQDFKEGVIKALIKTLSSQKDSLDGVDNGDVLNNAQSLVNSFIFFLEKGYLPWYRTTKKTSAWENELINGFSVNEYEYFLDWWRDNYQLNQVITHRLILQFSDILLQKIISAIAPDVRESWELIYKDYAWLLKTLLKVKHVARYEIWKYLFHILLNSKDNLWPSLALKLLVVHFDLESGELNKVDSRVLKTLTVKNALKQFDEANDADKAYDNGKELAKGWSRNKTKKWDSEEDTLYVTNSGILILHYFLKPFFEDLKLFVAGKFVNDKARQRAVLLLHYLATGESGAAEFDLPLEKILCGYPLESTLPNRIVLTRKERAESEKLLNAVIDYWVPLRNTSIEGLRNTFLQREGKLVTKENGWLLIVEQKTVDILLDKLPWGFSTIRLPWMEQILNVDWY
jgi:hypothetical protein